MRLQARCFRGSVGPMVPPALRGRHESQGPIRRNRSAAYSPVRWGNGTHFQERTLPHLAKAEEDRSPGKAFPLAPRFHGGFGEFVERLGRQLKVGVSAVEFEDALADKGFVRCGQFIGGGLGFGDAVGDRRGCVEGGQWSDRGRVLAENGPSQKADYGRDAAIEPDRYDAWKVAGL